MRKTVARQCRVIRNRKLDKSGLYNSIVVDGFGASGKIYPGQFVHIKIEPGLDPYFRRAFSIADYDENSGELTVIYKIVGKGTALLREKSKNDFLDLIGPLGTRFSPISDKKKAVLVAGGVGLPPLLFLAKRLVQKGHPGKKILFFYGGRSRTDLIEIAAIRRRGVTFIPCTDDGSYGYKGVVTDAVARHIDRLDRKRTFIYGCGPEPMLVALQELAGRMGFDGELSLEAPMPCGVGVCLGCIKPTLEKPHKYVRVCYEGPVFKIGEIMI